MAEVTDFNAVAKAQRRYKAVKLYAEQVSVPEIARRTGMTEGEVRRAVNYEVARMGKERGAFGEAARDRYFMDLDAVSRAAWDEWERQRQEVVETKQSRNEGPKGGQGVATAVTSRAEVRKTYRKADAALLAVISRNVEVKMRVLGFIQPAKVYVDARATSGDGPVSSRTIVVLGGFDVDPDALRQVPETPDASPPLLPPGIVLPAEP